VKIISILIALSSIIFALSEKETYLLEECAANSQMACFEYAKYLKKSCAIKNSNACLELGKLYLKGNGVKQHNGKAIVNFGKACDLKNKLGCELFHKYIVF